MTLEATITTDLTFKPILDVQTYGESQSMAWAGDLKDVRHSTSNCPLSFCLTKDVLKRCGYFQMIDRQYDCSSGSRQSRSPLVSPCTGLVALNIPMQVLSLSLSVDLSL